MEQNTKGFVLRFIQSLVLTLFLLAALAAAAPVYRQAPRLAEFQQSNSRRMRRGAPNPQNENARDVLKKMEVPIQ